MKITIAFVMVCLTAMVAGCAPAASPTSTATLTPVSLKVFSPNIISYAPFWIAYEQGYFKEQALNVELVTMPSADALPALIANQLDVIGYQLTPGLFNSLSRGGNIKFVADKGYIDPKGCENFVLVARPELADIAKTDPQQLKGKHLSYSVGSWTEYSLEKVFAKANLKISDFQIADTNSTTVVEAMKQGQVDIATQNEPTVTRLYQAGMKEIMTPISAILPGAETSVTLFGSKLLGDHSDVGNRFMIAYLKAVHAYNEGKTDSNLKIVAKYTQLDTETLKNVCWQALRQDGTVDTASIDDFQNWAVGKKLLDKVVPASQYYDASFTKYADDALAHASK